MEYSRYFLFDNVDGDRFDYYWATRDDKQTPRRMVEVDSRFKDFIMTSYDES